MKVYIDETYYLSIYKGGVPKTGLSRLIIEASSYVRKHTFDRVLIRDIPEEVKQATCLIVDKIYDAEKQKREMGNLKSQNIEGWSETYKTDEEIDLNLEKEKAKILDIFLSDLIGIDGNFLLYRGV